MSFKQAIAISHNESVQQPHKNEWISIDMAYAKFHEDYRDKQAHKRGKDRDHDKLVAIGNALSPVFDSLKNYWSQFGFLSSANLVSMVQHVKGSVVIDFTDNSYEYADDEENTLYTPAIE